jgi:hypothetical protein
MVYRAGCFRCRIEFLPALRERRVTGRRRAGAGRTFPADAARDKQALLARAESWSAGRRLNLLLLLSYDPACHLRIGRTVSGR